MSTDSSSKEKPNILAAVLLSLATIFIFIAAQFIGIVLLVIMLSVAGLSPEEQSDLLSESIPAQTLAVIFVETLTIGSLWGWYRFEKKDFLKEIGLRVKPTIDTVKYTLKAYGLYFVSFITLVLLSPILLPWLDTEQSQQLGFENPTGFEYGLVFLTLVVLVPIAEEILFRGFYLNKLKKYIPLKAAVVVTSIVFAIAHLEFLADGPLNWIAALDTFILALFLGWLVVKTKSLWASMLLHMLKNFVAFLFLFLI